MARFLGLLKLAPEGARLVIDDGPSARREHYQRMAAEAGGTIEGSWLTNVGDWDLVLLLDVPGATAAEGAAATLARTAAGSYVAERWIELIDLDDVAEALASMTK